MVLGYLVLTLCYYKNVFDGRNLLFMSQALFGADGSSYNQSAILTPENTLDSSQLAVVGLPRYTTTYAISQMCYNFSLGAAIVHVLLWNWPELTRAFGKMRFLHTVQDIDDPHYRGRCAMCTSLSYNSLTIRCSDEEVHGGTTVVVPCGFHLFARNRYWL